MADILIKNGCIVTMDAHCQIIERGSVAIEGGKIAAVGKSVGGRADKVIDARGKAVMPGLINCHTHLPMVLLRGIADDMPLMDWLQNRIWPVEQKFRARDSYAGALLGCLEMIRSGTTCFADQYFNMEQVAKAVGESGIRGALCYGMIDQDDPARMKAELSVGRRFVRAMKGKSRITAMFGPHSPYTCSTECLLKTKEEAKKAGVGIHIHLAESNDEVRQTIDKYGRRPVEYLESIGFLGPEVLAAHCVWAGDREIKLLRARGVKPAHCPVSNMKLGSGVAPVPEMLEAGIPVALGTDGAATNNSLDMIKEMKFAALLGKIHKMNPTAIPAGEALEMATSNGAAALGLCEKLGSVEAGKRADLILVDLKRPHLTPVHSVVSHLVYAATGADVDTTIVDGRVLMEGGEVLSLDEEKVLELAQTTSDDLISRWGGKT